jgi:hypothetical protein
MVGKDKKSHGARSELNPVFGLENVDRRNPISNIRHRVQISPHEIFGLSNHEKEALRQEISK